MEEILQYGIWKNRLPFHSIACPAGGEQLTAVSTVTGPEIELRASTANVSLRQSATTYKC